MEIMKQVSRNQ